MNIEKFEFFINIIRSNRTLRRKLAQWSHPLFNLIYLPRYASAPTAPFQREIFSLTEKKDVELCVIAGFRESGKTSICTISFPIWAILSGQAHFVVIASQTRTQARQHLANIRRQLENNPLLKNDFGPFDEESDEWGAFAISSKKYDARIIAISTDQAVRGALYKHYRPDLIICDDIEDLNSTKTQEMRDKIFNWFVSEIIPLGSKHTRIFVLGNFLHEFSLVGRLMAQLESKERDGISKRYPLIDEQGKCLWPGMYPDNEALKAKQRKVGDEATWTREYLLTIISSTDKLVPYSWIHYYNANDLPPKDKTYQYTWSAADLAISKNEGADYTAIVSAQVYIKDEKLKIYVLEDPINKHLDFPQAIETMRQILHTHGESSRTKMYIEAVGFQEAYYQQMFSEGYRQVEPVKVILDKRTRLALITKFIKDGTIVFSRKGTDALITQLVGFGKENHDDLVDSLTMLVSKILEEYQRGAGFRGWLKFVEWNGGMFVDIGGGARPSRGLLTDGMAHNRLVDDEKPLPWWRKNDDDAPPNPVAKNPTQPRRPSLGSLGVLNESYNRSSRGDYVPLRSSSGVSPDPIFRDSSSSSGLSSSSNRSLGGMLGDAANRRFGGR